MPDFSYDKKTTRYLEIFFLSFIFLLFFLLNLPFAFKQFLSPDAALYLDAARNIAAGRGAVVTLNQYQFWQGISYPLWSYTQPLFSVFAALPFKFGGVAAVIAFNIFLFAINCGLVYLITRRLAGVFAGIAAALIVGFAYNMVYIAIYPWTDQLFLTLVLGGVYLILSGGRRYFLAGVLLGVSCLARVAGFYSAITFCAAVLLTGGLPREYRFPFLKVAVGFFLVIVSYEIFCLLRCHAFYPEYMAHAVNYNNARKFGGAFYAPGKDVLHVIGVPTGFLSQSAANAVFCKELVALLDPCLFLLAAPFIYLACLAHRDAGRFVKAAAYYSVINVFLP